MKTITAQALYNLTRCAHRMYLDANGDPQEKGEVSAFVKLLWELGLQTEREYLAMLGEKEVVDLTSLRVGRREAEAMRLANEEAVRPFDLARGPLFRARLVRLAPEDHMLLMTMHHIVSDGWSMGVIYQEMAAHYEACLAGRPPDLPELEIQYADFAVWQRRWLRGDKLEEQLAYWKEKLDRLPAERLDL